LTIIYSGKWIAVVDVPRFRASEEEWKQIDSFHGQGFSIERVEERDEGERYILWRDYDLWSANQTEIASAKQDLKNEDIEEFQRRMHTIKHVLALPEPKQVKPLD